MSNTMETVTMTLIGVMIGVSGMAAALRVSGFTLTRDHNSTQVVSVDAASVENAEFVVPGDHPRAATYRWEVQMVNGRDLLVSDTMGFGYNYVMMVGVKNPETYAEGDIFDASSYRDGVYRDGDRSRSRWVCVRVTGVRHKGQ